jgi:hypothetical protein
MFRRSATTALSICAIAGLACGKSHPKVERDAEAPAVVNAPGVSTSLAFAPQPDAGIRDGAKGAPGDDGGIDTGADAGLGCRYARRGGPGSDKRWLVSLEIHGPTPGERYFSLDIDKVGFYYAALEEPLLGISLPAKEECTRHLSDAELASFERAVREADICALPLQSPTQTPPSPSYDLSDPRYARLRMTRWSLLLCTDFGARCSVQRRADEWTQDPKLKRLLAAIEAVARATCR